MARLGSSRTVFHGLVSLPRSRVQHQPLPLQQSATLGRTCAESVRVLCFCMNLCHHPRNRRHVPQPRKKIRYATNELRQLLMDPEVIADIDRMLGIQKEMGGLAKVADAVGTFHELEGDIEAARMMVDEETDPDSKAYAQEELDGLITKRDALAIELEDLATAGDSITRGSLIMEIRAGTGGDEAALFAKNLYDMYMRVTAKPESGKWNSSSSAPRNSAGSKKS